MRQSMRLLSQYTFGVVVLASLCHFGLGLGSTASVTSGAEVPTPDFQSYPTIAETKTPAPPPTAVTEDDIIVIDQRFLTRRPISRPPAIVPIPTIMRPLPQS